MTLTRDGYPTDIINTGHNFCGVKDLKDRVLSNRVPEDFLRRVKQEAAAAPDSLKPIAEVLVRNHGLGGRGGGGKYVGVNHLKELEATHFLSPFLCLLQVLADFGFA